MTEDLRTDPAARNIRVVKDSSFHRCVADTGLVIDLGRDLEIAFIQTSPEVSNRFSRDSENEDDEVEQGFVMEPSLTEVSRVRINRPNALMMAMMIVETLIEDGRINEDGFMAQIKGIFDKHRSSEQLEQESE